MENKSEYHCTETILTALKKKQTTTQKQNRTKRPAVQARTTGNLDPSSGMSCWHRVGTSVMMNCRSSGSTNTSVLLLMSVSLSSTTTSEMKSIAGCKIEPTRSSLDVRMSRWRKEESQCNFLYFSHFSFSFCLSSFFSFFFHVPQ